MILVITNKEDSHPTPVIQLLTERGISVFRLNTEALLTDYEFCWQNDAHHCDFTLANIQNGLSVRGTEVTAVWDRRPEPPTELPLQSTEVVDKHNREEALGFLRFLRYYLKDIPSIGSIVYDRVAASKMLQTTIAQQVGLSVPDTCFSNRKADILRFAMQYKEIVLKPIENSNIWNEDNEEEYALYTQKTSSASLHDVPEEAFTQTVSYVQNYVPKAYELRITMVGRRAFACKIDSQCLDEDKGKTDWRQGYDYGLKHEFYNLPQDIADKCIRFLQLMHLNFGAFDFIVTPSGEYVFLECNHNGQWLWVELEIGMKISEAIADFLQNLENTQEIYGIR